MKCVVCGKEIEHGYLCGKCMVEKTEVVRVSPLEILMCSRCGAIRVGRRWVRRELDDVIEDLILKNTRVAEEFDVREVVVDPSSHIVYYRGTIAGDEVEVRLPFTLTLKKLSCPKCSRESGGYYESIVQVRAKNRELEEEEMEKVIGILEEVLEKEGDNEKAFISKIERKKGGVDIYLGSRNIGMKVSRRISRELGAEITESKKLHTRIDGRDVYRFTYSVKAPEFREGDVVDSDGKMCLVKNVRSKKGVDILTGKTINLGREPVVARKGGTIGGVVVNVDKTTAEIVCDDGKVVSVDKPYGVKIGSEVRVFKHLDRYYAYLNDL